MPQLEQRHYDLIGLGARRDLASFFSFVFYLGWDGGKVGSALQEGFELLFGKVGYLAPLALFGLGAVLVLRPLLPSVRPVKAGAALPVRRPGAGLRGRARSASGPERTAARRASMEAAHLKIHGGAVGESFYWVTETLFAQFGTNILFLLLITAGILLLTGASIAGMVEATHEGVSADDRARASLDHRFRGRRDGQGARRRAEDARLCHPRERRERRQAADQRAARGRPLGRDGGRRAAAAAGRRADRARDPRRGAGPAAGTSATTRSADPLEPRRGDHREPLRAGAGARGRASEVHNTPDDGVVVETAVPAARKAKQLTDDDLTPQGKLRSNVTEADDFDYDAAEPEPAQALEGHVRRRPDRRGAHWAACWSRRSAHFGVESKIVGTVSGPHITRYEVRLAPGVKMSKVSGLKDDLAYALAATDVRILAPIPGKQAVGVEVPNVNRQMVHLGDVFQDAPKGWSPLTVWLGKDIAGKAIGTDLAKQPHILVAGTTGSGKSGCVNAMLSSILLHASPERGASSCCRPQAGRAQPLRVDPAPDHAGRHVAAAGRERAPEPDQGDGVALHDHDARARARATSPR